VLTLTYFNLLTFPVCVFRMSNELCAVCLHHFNDDCWLHKVHYVLRAKGVRRKLLS